MTTIHIPGDREALTSALSGLDALLTAKEWERAAIVYAWTDDKNGRPRKTDGNPSVLTVTDFAALRIKGLKNREQVAAYRAAWEKGGGDQKIKPGDTVTLPKADWSESFQSDPRDKSTHTIATTYIAKNPEVVREATQAFPNVAAVVADTVAESPALQADVAHRAFVKRTGTRHVARVTPAMGPLSRDRDNELNSHIFAINALLREERDGVWTPDGISESLLRLLGISLADRHAKNEPDIFDQIDSHLAESRR